jgi:hypothetical protein
MALLLVGLYRCGYRSYKEVAVWATPGSHEALIYEEETFLLGGQLGKGNLTKSKFPVDEIIGRVADEAETTAEETAEETSDAEETTAAETEPPEEDEEPSEEEETTAEPETVIPPYGAEWFSDKPHTYVLYSVKDKADYLLLLEADGQLYVYHREGSKLP